MALARLTGGTREAAQPPEPYYRRTSRGLRDMPVDVNEPRNWDLSNEYTGNQAFDLFNIGPVLGLDWILINNTTDAIAVTVDDDQTYTIQSNQMGGRRNTKFIRLVIVPVDAVAEYSLHITGIKP